MMVRLALAPSAKVPVAFEFANSQREQPSSSHMARRSGAGFCGGGGAGAAAPAHVHVAHVRIAAAIAHRNNLIAKRLRHKPAQYTFLRGLVGAKNFAWVEAEKEGRGPGKKEILRRFAPLDDGQGRWAGRTRRLGEAGRLAIRQL
jgi:hypothetical protein